MNLKKKLAEAQRRLSSRLILKWDGREVNLMAGADFGYSYKEKKIGASVVVFKIPELEIVEVSEAVREIEVPYLPGFLAYREGCRWERNCSSKKNGACLLCWSCPGHLHHRMCEKAFLPFCLAFGTEGVLHSF
jgi:deoxyinosine 3'endonuclease (endonuclease V)